MSKIPRRSKPILTEIIAIIIFLAGTLTTYASTLIEGYHSNYFLLVGSLARAEITISILLFFHAERMRDCPDNHVEV